MLKRFSQRIRANYQPVLFVFLAFFAMVLVGSRYAVRLVNSQLQLIGRELLNTTEMAVLSNLSEAEVTFAGVAQNVEAMLQEGADHAVLLAYLEQTNTRLSGESSPLPDFMKIYAAVDDVFLDGSGWVPPDGYVPRQRPWHIGAMGESGIFFSDPYLDADTGGLCISYSRQVGEAAVLAVDLDLTRITSYLCSQQLGESGYGILLSDTDQIMAHRDNHLIGLSAAEAEPGLPLLLNRMRNGEEMLAARFIGLEGMDSIAFLRPIFDDWAIGVITPRASYYAPATHLTWMLVALGLVLATALSMVLVHTREQRERSIEESRSKSDFLSRMSHEMRTPMNAIMGMADIARRTDDPEQIDYCLDRIGDASNHLLGVINDILDMSKIEAGKLELLEEPFVLRSMVQQVVGVMNFKFEQKAQRFSAVVEESVPEVIVSDRQRMAQVVTNLLSNANKFTPEGGEIRLILRALSLENNLCRLQIEVADTGIGISPEQQERLFSSFEQADSSISRKYGGTGLGLSISKRIIDLMGGVAEIFSELGEGARFVFTVSVPVGSVPAASGVSDAADERTDFSGHVILLAEDMEINREVLMAQLADTRVEIDIAENGRIACDLFRHDPDRYDLIFMDLQMPELDGLDATRAIRAMDFPRAGIVPIIAMTANVFREDIERCREAGMNAHVGKPINLNEVLSVMRQYLPVE